MFSGCASKAHATQSGLKRSCSGLWVGCAQVGSIGCGLPHFGPVDWVRVLFGDRELKSDADPADTRMFSTNAERQQVADCNSSRHKRVVRRRLGSADWGERAHGRGFLRNVRSLRRMRRRNPRAQMSVRWVPSGSLGQGGGGQI